METTTASSTAHSGTVEGSLGKKILMSTLMPIPSNTPMTPPAPVSTIGFGQKLPDDVAAARANRFAHADFARALRDRHQHDVHHAHAADQQSDRADHGGQQSDRTGDLLELVGNFRRR